MLDYGLSIKLHGDMASVKMLRLHNLVQTSPSCPGPGGSGRRRTASR